MINEVFLFLIKFRSFQIDLTVTTFTFIINKGRERIILVVLH